MNQGKSNVKIISYTLKRTNRRYLVRWMKDKKVGKRKNMNKTKKRM